MYWNYRLYIKFSKRFIPRNQAKILIVSPINIEKITLPPANKAALALATKVIGLVKTAFPGANTSSNCSYVMRPYHKNSYSKFCTSIRTNFLFQKLRH